MDENSAKLPSQLVFKCCLLICTLFVVFKTSVQFEDNDFFMYVTMGRDFWSKGYSLLRDHYSVFHSGISMTSSPWLFMLIIGVVEKYCGLIGVSILRSALFISPVLYFYRYLLSLKEKLGKFETCLFLITLACSVVLLTQMRPNKVSLIFALIFSVQCVRAYQSDVIKKSLILQLFLIELIWIQCHLGAAGMGYAIFGSFLFCKLIKLVQLRPLPMSEIKKVIVTGGLFLLIGFLHPFPQPLHPLIGGTILDFDLASRVTEFDPIKIFDLAAQQVYWPVFTVFFIYAALSKDLFAVFLLGVFGTYGTVSVTAFVPIVVASLPIFVKLFIDFKNDTRIKVLGSHKRSTIALTFLVVLAIGFALPFLPKNAEWNHAGSLFTAENVAAEFSQPIKIADYMKSKGYEGNIYSEGSLSPYLLYTLDNRSKVMLDNRLWLLYSKKDLNIYHMANINPLFLSSILKKGDFKFIVSSNFIYDSINSSATRLKRVSVEFADDPFRLYTVDRNSGYPTLTSVIADPGCIRLADLAAITKELERAKSQEKTSPQLLEAMEIIQKYLTDQHGFLLKLKGKQFNFNQWSSTNILGEIALVEGDLKTAFTFFSSTFWNREPNALNLAKLIKLTAQLNLETQYKTLLELIPTAIIKFGDEDLLKFLLFTVKNTIQKFPPYIELGQVATRSVEAQIKDLQRLTLSTESERSELRPLCSIP